MSRAIARLGAIGYIDRQISASDRRQNRLEITPAGIRIFERCLVVASNVQTEVLRSLTAAEEKAFLAILLKIESGIGAILGKAGPDE